MQLWKHFGKLLWVGALGEGAMLVQILTKGLAYEDRPIEFVTGTFGQGWRTGALCAPGLLGGR